MIATNRLSLAGAAVALFVATGAMARAQESPAPAPTPEPIASPTLMDQQYDGRLHVTAAPYVWAPTARASYQYAIPTLPHKPGGIVQSAVQVGPTDYVPKLNAAFMFSFEARKGEANLFGDIIYVNASTSASTSTIVSGPIGHVQIPVTLNTDARLAVAVWEVALGFAIAHGHNADLNLFGGVREFPLDVNVSYNAIIGKRGIIAPTGSFKSSERTDDVIFGVRGKAFLGDRWFIPYYADAGAGANNQTWEAFGGVGTAFNHGQTLVVLYRALDYYGFPADAHVQKLSLGGPLIGYTFQL